MLQQSTPVSVRWQRHQVTYICTAAFNHSNLSCNFFFFFVSPCLWFDWHMQKLGLRLIRPHFRDADLSICLPWLHLWSGKWVSLTNGAPIMPNLLHDNVFSLCCLWSWLAPLARTQWCCERCLLESRSNGSWETAEVSHFTEEVGLTVFHSGVKTSLVRMSNRHQHYRCFRSKVHGTTESGIGIKGIHKTHT